MPDEARHDDATVGEGSMGEYLSMLAGWERTSGASSIDVGGADVVGGVERRR